MGIFAALLLFYMRQLRQKSSTEEANNGPEPRARAATRTLGLFARVDTLVYGVFLCVSSGLALFRKRRPE